MALTEITYHVLFGKPLIFWFANLAIWSMLACVGVVLATKRGVKLDFRWHIRLGYFATAMAVIHGMLGFFTYLGW